MPITLDTVGTVSVCGTAVERRYKSKTGSRSVVHFGHGWDGEYVLAIGMKQPNFRLVLWEFLWENDVVATQTTDIK